ncbi:MAG: cysteine desulfurase family protein [Patescibacteria group bacterium]
MVRKKIVYLDHAATTPVREEVQRAMQPFFSSHYGNPSSLYREGTVARGALAEARQTIARIIGAQPETIVFTSGGTEGNNLAIFGLAEANHGRGRKMISTDIEHHTILEPLKQLEKQGYSLTLLSPNNSGLFDPDKVIAAITPETVLVTVMLANNEIGAIEPIALIGRRILQYRKAHNTALPYFHTDACQAAGYLDLNVEKLHVDLMTLNAGKIYGPKGVGMLYVRRGVKINARQFGGMQENNLRAGTENIPGIIGFAKALELAQKDKVRETARLYKLSNYFWKKIKKNFPDAILNGPPIGRDRLPNNLSVTFPGYDGEQLVIYLDAEGVMCSTASACAAMSDEPSHVLCSLQIPAQGAKSTLRFSLGKSTTKTDLDYAIKALAKVTKLIKSR